MPVPDPRGSLFCPDKSQLIFAAALVTGGAFPISAHLVHDERLSQLFGGVVDLAGMARVTRFAY